MKDLIQRLRQYSFFQIFTIYTRYLIGGGFLFASIVKIKGLPFTQISTEHEVGFFFDCFHQMGEYWQFLGWSQLVAAFLIMTQRFATLGAMLFFGIILNIVIITTTLDFGLGTPIMTSLMLLATTYLLLWDYNKISLLFQQERNIKVDYTSNHLSIIDHQWWAYLGLILFIISVICGLDRGTIMIWFLLCFTVGLIGCIAYFIVHRKKEIEH